MQNLKQFIDFYLKHFPKSAKDKSKMDAEKEILEQKKKLRSFFFNCNLKKSRPKNPPMYPVFINKEEGEYLWIVKPPFLNRGRGIQIFSNLAELSKFVT